MAIDLEECPPKDVLLESLARCVAPGQGLPALELLDRRPNVYQSSSASEVIVCRIHGQGEQRIFCKYGHGDEIPTGHRGGTHREALVYKYVLAPLQLRPRLFGSHLDLATGNTWLFVEFLGECLRMQQGPQPQAMKWAIEWIAHFHAMNESRIATLDFLPRYDLDYYLSWVERTERFAVPLVREMPWLEKLYARAERLLSVLVEGPQTVVHAEYFPHNVLLLEEGGACAIDWESAAIAPGEIDLASLRMGWPDDLKTVAEEHYGRLRWSDGANDRFEERLGAARLYWGFRWLGDRREWTLDPVCHFWFDELREVGSRFGLL